MCVCLIAAAPGVGVSLLHATTPCTCPASCLLCHGQAQHAEQLDQLAGRQRDALAAAEAKHAATLAALKQQQAGQLEAALADLAAATQRLSSGAALGEDQVAGVRAAALAAAREEAAAEAAALKRQLMEDARARVEKEVCVLGGGGVWAARGGCSGWAVGAGQVHWEHTFSSVSGR